MHWLYLVYDGIEHSFWRGNMFQIINTGKAPTIMLNASIYSGNMNLCDRDKLRLPSQCLLSSLEGSWQKNLRNWFLARNEFIAWTEYLIYILQKFLIHSERKRNHYLDVIFHPGQSESKSKIAINQIFGGKEVWRSIFEYMHT